MEGWLFKRSARGKWQRRFCKWEGPEGNDSCSLYYSVSPDAPPKGSVDLNTVSQVRLCDANAALSSGLAFELCTASRFWGFAATTDNDMAWYSALRNHVGQLLQAQDLAECPREQSGGALAGWLFKRGKLNKRWQRRWCVLDQRRRLQYFKNKESSRPQGSITIDPRGISIRPCDGADNHDVHAVSFELHIRCPKRTYFFGTSSQPSAKAWHAALSAT